MLQSYRRFPNKECIQGLLALSPVPGPSGPRPFPGESLVSPNAKGPSSTFGISSSELGPDELRAEVRDEEVRKADAAEDEVGEVDDREARVLGF